MPWGVNGLKSRRTAYSIRAASGVSLFAAGIFVISGAYISNPLLSDLLIAMAGARVVSAFMNTGGQVGGALSPVIFALLTEGKSDWSALLYLTGVLYVLGALCWIGICPDRAHVPKIP